MTQFKMENGVRLPLTTQEQADYDAQQLAWPTVKASQAAQVNTSDPQTQIATIMSVLVNKGLIKATDLPANIVTVINSKLTSLGKVGLN